MAKEKIRCSWCLKDNLYKNYHDEEWGTPLHNDQKLFELLCLEGAQAGLSWYTILAKRENYRKAFDGFDAKKMAKAQTAEEALAQKSCLAHHFARCNCPPHLSFPLRGN